MIDWNTAFPVLTISRALIKEAGFTDAHIATLTDEDMTTIAEKLADMLAEGDESFLENLFIAVTMRLEWGEAYAGLPDENPLWRFILDLVDAAGVRQAFERQEGFSLRLDNGDGLPLCLHAWTSTAHAPEVTREVTLAKVVYLDPGSHEEHGGEVSDPTLTLSGSGELLHLRRLYGEWHLVYEQVAPDIYAPNHHARASIARFARAWANTLREEGWLALARSGGGAALSSPGEKPQSVVTVFPLSEADLWGVTLHEGDETLHESKASRVVALARARDLAHEHHVRVTCTLEHFFALTIEADGPGRETFTATDGSVLTWERALYGGDRLGLDQLAVEKAGKSRGSFIMYHDTDSGVVDAILQLIAPGSDAAAVCGQLS